MSQTKQVRNALLHGAKISQLSALREFGIMRLADCIWKLRGQGFTIKTGWRKTRDGRRFAVYTLDQCADGKHFFRMKGYIETCKFCGEIGKDKTPGKKVDSSRVACSPASHTI